MELLNGMDLQTLVSEHGSLPPARVIHILAQVCESLAEAHERGLVHRDIKPANIQICRMGRECDFVKVLDFGLVKTDAPSMAEPGLTAPNMLAGTPAYLSPETALGEAVDQRTDVYSCGCVAYWMLTGRQVFQAQSPMQMIAHHIQTPPQPPSLHSPYPIPGALEELVLSCLAKRPADRPASAVELGDRLGVCHVTSHWTRDDARRWWEKRLEPEPAVTLR
jgi:serine/threonine-protein kinase